MLPPIFKLLNTEEIQNFVGKHPARIFDFAYAPQDVSVPYVVFSQVAHEPHAQISGAPLSDTDVVQIDCYDNDRGRVRKLANAVRNVLDNAGQGNRMIMQDYEKESGLYRIGFEVDFISNRE